MLRLLFLLLLLSPVSVWGQTPTPCATMVGQTTIPSTGIYDPSQEMAFNAVTLLVNSTVDGINYYFTAQASPATITAGLYNDNSDTPNGSLIFQTTVINPPNTEAWYFLPCTVQVINAGNYWIGVYDSTEKYQYGNGSNSWYGQNLTFSGTLPSPAVSTEQFTGKVLGMNLDLCASAPTFTPTNTPTNTPVPPTPTFTPVPCATLVGESTPPPINPTPTPSAFEEIYGLPIMIGNPITIASPINADGFNFYLGPTGPAQGGVTADYPVTVQAGLYTVDGSSNATLVYGSGPISVYGHLKWVFIPGVEQVINPGTYEITYSCPVDIGGDWKTYLYNWADQTSCPESFWTYTYSQPVPTFLSGSNHNQDENCENHSLNIDTCTYGPFPTPTPSPSHSHGSLLGVWW